jgi:hypothetical protein
MDNCREVAMSDERKLRSHARLYRLLGLVYDWRVRPFYERARSRAVGCGTLAPIDESPTVTGCRVYR